MLVSVHIGHMDMTKCTHRAKDIMFWPKMTSEIQEMISKCTLLEIPIARNPLLDTASLIGHGKYCQLILSHEMIRTLWS